MNKSDLQLMQRLGGRLNSYENHYNDAGPAAPPVMSGSTVLGSGKNQPAFAAQFDIEIKLRYFTESSGTYTGITASALTASLKNNLPAFIFGLNDFQAGFANLKRQFALSGQWQYGNPVIVGKDTPRDAFGVWDSTVLAALEPGDLVLPYTAVTTGPSVNTLGLVIIRSSQVAYGTLLNAISGTRFVMNMIRYVLNTPSTLSQYNNSIILSKGSLFGRDGKDSVSPNSFKQPEQQQDNIIDIPIKKGIDSQVALATRVNFDAVDNLWSIFVFSVNKVTDF